MKRVSKRSNLVARTSRVPHYLKSEVVAMTALVVVGLFFGAVTLDRYISKNGSPYIAAVVVSSLVELANQDREANGLNELTVNSELIAAAQAKANDMAQKGYFAHQSPEGFSPWHWFQKAGYTYVYAGENLATDFSESGDVERAWMQSPGHRENILNPHYSEIGIATAVGTFEGRERVYAVQMFGAPQKVQKTQETVEATVPASATVKATKPDQVAPVTADATQGASVLGETSVPAGPPQTLPGSNIELLQKADIPFWAYAAANPKSSLRWAYYVIAGFILMLLAIDTELEIKWHHFAHARRVGGLLLTMSMLFLVADWVFFSTPILAQAAFSWF